MHRHFFQLDPYLPVLPDQNRQPVMFLGHGSWGVLKPMFAQADIPVVQLSMDAHRSAPDHVAVGRALGHLRQRGVLVVGSGNVVHNLPAMQPQAQPHSWAADFDNWVAQTLTARDMQALQNWQTHPAAPLAHPSVEHFLPLLYAAGAADGQDEVTFFNTTFQAAAISMRSVVWA